MARITEIRIKDFSDFEELSRLERKIGKLRKKADALREKLLPAVKAVGDVYHNHVHYVFSQRSSWEYSDKVAKLSGMLEARKQYERERNIAKKGASSEYIKIQEDKV